MANEPLSPDAFVIDKSRYGTIMCYAHTNEETRRRPGEMSPISNFILALFFSNLTYRVFYHLTRPLYMPPFVAQILCGLLFSPTWLGETEFITKLVFTYKFRMAHETLANLALVYNIFLLGLEMDLRLVRLTGLKPFIIAVAGVVASLSVGVALYNREGNGAGDRAFAGCIFWSIALSCTNFPDLARILADLKLLRTDMGRTAMSAAILTDLSTWVLLVFAFSAFSKEGTWNKMMPFVVLCMVALVLLCIFVIRPGISWAFAKTIKGGNVGDNHVWYTLAGVMLCGLVTDAIGAYSITGAFLFGLAIPHDHVIRDMIEEKLHDFLSGILMPVFFISCGLRTDLKHMTMYIETKVLVFVIITSFMIKIISTIVVSLFLRMPIRESLAVGSLMNTKGVLALVVLNAGRDTKALDTSMYTHMIIVFLAMSMVVEPFLALTYRPKKKSAHYKHRTIQKIKEETEFRVLACVHILSNASGIANLLRVSNATKQSPLNVFGIHLVELTGRTAAASMLILNEGCKPKVNFLDHVKAESDQIAETFETLEVNNEAVSVQTITAVSPYPTMHEDICALAEDKQVCFVILPYHKHQMADGKMGEGNASHADINLNVLDHAPCSVGLLVDRGVGTTRSESFHGKPGKRKVAMLFIGGPDDREALSYAWRMVGHHTVNLTVVRFVPGRGALLSSGESAVSYEKEKQVDDEYIYEFNFKTMNDHSVTYIEKVVNEVQDAVATIRDLEDNNSYDLYVVGRRYGVDSPVTAGLSDWTTQPDLGTIGDTLASSNFTMHASVLVVQQYSAAAADGVGDNQESGEDQFKTSRDTEPFMKSMYEDDEDEDDYQCRISKRKVAR